MRIGVIGAMQIEVDNLKASMSDISTKEYSGVTYVCGTIGDKEVVAAVCGIGKVFAAICAEAMILEFHVDYVINIGVGGTLCKELGVMDVAVADKVVQHDMNTTPLGDPVGLLSGINEVYLPTDEKMCRLLGSCLAEKEFTIMSERLPQGICLSAHRSRRQRFMSGLMRLPVRWKADLSDMSVM